MKQLIHHTQPTTHNPFAPSATHTSIHPDVSMEAVVVDVIVNDEHDMYKSAKDGYNVGSVKVRLLRSDHFKDDSVLSWARPLESNITEYPLIGELVLVHSILNKFFYSRKINVSSKITTQVFSRLNDEYQPILSQTSNLESSKAVPVKQTGRQQSVGQYFSDLKTNRLKNFEGDLIIEGRTGSSIRFGNSFKTNKTFTSTDADQAPNMLLRVGQSTKTTPSPNTQFGLVLEDIDGDVSSMWLVADQVIPITLSTSTNKTIHGKSIPDFPAALDKGQIVLTSDRIVVNSRLDKVLVHSGNGIHLTSLKNVSIDTSQDYFSWIGRDRKIEIVGSNIQNVRSDLKFWVGKSATVYANTSLNLLSSGDIVLQGKNLRIGSPTATEPMVLGNALTTLLTDIIDAFLSTASRQVITSTGPGRMNPTTQIKLNQIKNKLSSHVMLSDDNFVAKKNKLPSNTHLSLH